MFPMNLWFHDSKVIRRNKYALAKSLFRVFARNEVTKQSAYISRGCQLRDCFASLAMTEFANAAIKIPCRYLQLSSCGTRGRRCIMRACKVFCVNGFGWRFLNVLHSAFKQDGKAVHGGLPVPDRQCPLLGDVF